jgi:hypothetical protein
MYESMIPESTQQLPTMYMSPLTHNPKNIFSPKNSSLYASQSHSACVPTHTPTYTMAFQREVDSRGRSSGSRRRYQRKY